MLRRSAPVALALALLVGVLGVIGAAPARAAAPVSPQLQVVVDAWGQSPTREYGTHVPITAQTTGTNGFDGVAGSWVVTRNGSRASSGWSLRGSFAHALQAEDPAGTYVVEFSFVPDDLETYLPEARSVTIERPKATATIDLGTPPATVRTGDSWSLPAGNPPHTVLAVAGGSTPGACEVAGTRVDFTGAGTCTIDATAPGTTNYLAATPRSTTFAVTAPPQTFSASPSPAYVGDTWRPTATGGGFVSVGSATSAVCRSVGNGVHFDTVGTCTAVLDTEATGGYAAAHEERSVRVVRVPVTVDAVALRLRPDGTHTATVRVGSPRGTPTGRVEVMLDGVGFFSLPLEAGVATGQVFGGAGAGETTVVDVRVWATTGSRWQPLHSARQEAVVLAEQPVTVEAPTGTLRAGDTWTPAISWTFPARPSSWSVEGPCERSGADVLLTGAGDCTLTAVQPGDDTAYVEGRASRTVTVLPAEQTFSGDPAPAYIDDTWTPTASGGGEVTATSTTPTTCTTSGGTITFHAAGACVVDLSAPAGGDLAATTIRRTVAVTAVPVTLEVTYGYRNGSAIQRLDIVATSPRGTPTGSVSWDFEGAGTVALVDGRARSFTYALGAGDQVYQRVRYAAQGRWAAATWGPSYYAVDKARQDVAISAPPADPRYRDTWSPQITWSPYATARSWTADGACSRDGDLVLLTDVGTCTVTAVQNGSSTYLEGRASRSFEVDRMQLGLTYTSPTSAYVGSDVDVTLTLDRKGADVPGTGTISGINGVVEGPMLDGTLSGTFPLRDESFRAEFVPADLQRVEPALVRWEVELLKRPGVVDLGGPAPQRAQVGDTWDPQPSGRTDGPTEVTSSGACEAGPGGTISFVRAGTCTVDFLHRGDDTFEDATRQVVVPVDRVPVTVALTLPERVRVGVPATITATATRPGGTIVPGRITLEAAGVELERVIGAAPVTFADLDFARAGSASLGVSFVPDDATTFAAYDGGDTVDVARGTQAIELATPAPTSAPAGSTWSPGATGGPSGQPVDVLAAPGDVCSATGGVVTFAAAGDCAVVLLQPGDADYEPAPERSFAVTVARRAAVLDITVPRDLVVGEPVEIEASVGEAGTVRFALDGDPLGDPVPVVDGVAGAELLPRAAGERRVTARFEPADPAAVAAAEREAEVRVARAATTTVLTLDGATLTAAVRAGVLAGVPTGDVAFRAGERLLGTVALDDGTASLPADLDPAWAGELTASYLGDGDRAPSAGSLERVLPTIEATVQADRPATAGWYDAPVVVAFACTPGSAPVTACPEPVRVGEGADQRISGAVVAADGARIATDAVVSVDATAPTVRLAGVGDGRVYKGGGASPACRSRDALSGPATCTLTRRTVDGWTTVTAHATDRAGRTASTTARYRVAHAWQLGRLAGVVGRVQRGERVWLVALTTGARPTLAGTQAVSVSRRPQRVHGLVRWHLSVRVPADARRGSTYAVTLGEERLRFRVR